MPGSPADFAHHVGLLIGQALSRQIATRRQPAAAAPAAPSTPPRRGPGKRAAPVPKKKARARAAPAKPAATKLRVGQRVQYQQGRGTFDAKVTRIEEKTGLVVLQRLKDNKRIKRPAAKVYASK